MGSVQSKVYKRASARRGKRSLAQLAESGRKSIAQLRRRNKIRKVRDYSTGETTEMAVLSPVARARRSMERELSLVLRRCGTKGYNRERQRDPHSELMAEPSIQRSARRSSKWKIQRHL